MSFPSDHKTVRSGKTYSQNLDLKLSVKTGNTTDASETRGAEKTDKNINPISPEMIEERIKANIEPLNKHILTFTQLLNQLI